MATHTSRAGGNAGVSTRRPSTNTIVIRRRRNRRLAAISTASVVLAVFVVVGVKLLVPAARPANAAGSPSTPAPASVVTAVTTMPLAQQLAASADTSVQAPTALEGETLNSAGRPEVLYIGAEFCPYCAAERWAVVSALAHFGTWSGLGVTTSSATDSFPSTPTLSFHGAVFTSPYLTFRGIEETTNQPCPTGTAGCATNGYRSLDSASTSENQLMEAHDPSGAIPFIDFGGAADLVGASYQPDVLAGQTVQEVARRLSQPLTSDAQQIGASAASLTRTLCRVTGGQPGAVCSALRS